MKSLYKSQSCVSCFDNEDPAAAAAADAAVKAAAADKARVEAQEAAARAAAAAQGKFTQEDVNRFLADDKRKHQAALAQMEQKLQSVLEDKNMTEATRKTLEENLSAIRGELRTKEEQLAIEKKRMEETHTQKVTELEKKAATWETLFRESTIERALQDAAVKNEAFNAEQIVILLRGNTKLLEDVDEKTGKTTGRYVPKVNMPSVDPQTGEAVTLTLDPEAAVRRMKETTDIYGNLFKPNVVSGIGAGQAAGGYGRSGEKVNVKALTPAQYREIREKNPEKLGLRPKSARR